MSDNIVEAEDVAGGSVLGFSRKNGGTAYYYYPGQSAAMAQANPRNGGQPISGTQAQMLKAQAKAEDYGEAAAEILPFLL